MWLLIEIFLVFVAVGIAFRFPELGSKWFGKVERAFGELARRRRLAVVVVAVLPVVVRLALLPLMPVPTPGGEDEFSYLLAADTFAHGRLTNQPHPMWIHFESINILQQPTYASMYFPVQGLFMAVGQVIFGSPWAGVLISIGIMCGAICWMLQGWLPARWALFGGMIAVMRIGLFSYWSNNFAGAAPAAIGGALVLGALPRIKRHQRMRDALLMAVGLVILANSRPYEGLIFSIPVGGALLAWMLGKNRAPLRVSVRNVVLPVVLVLVVAAGAMGYYNWRVSGNPFLMPEQLNQDMFHRDRFFLWQSPRPQLDFRHKEMRDYSLYWVKEFQEARSLGGAVLLTWKKMIWIWVFYLGPVLTLPILALAAIVPYGYTWSRISPRLRFLLCIFGVTMVGLLPEFYFNPHYVAASTGLMLALVLISMRYLRLWQWREKPVGMFLVRAVPLICIVMAILCVGAKPMYIRFAASYPQSWCSTQPSNPERAQILGELVRLPGRQLVVVRYNASHNPDVEWVYNGADIDNAKVVWAHEMDEGRNHKLITYFKDRRVWLVEPDETPPKLSPYPVSFSP